MLEAKYYRDYGHNYMILKCKQQEEVRNYQYRILTSGKISNILNCSVRHINGATYYYYDISSRTTLESLYRNKKMSYEEVRDIFFQIHGIGKELAEYFMDETGLVLIPEYIYYNFADKRYVGLYYPDYKTAGPDAYKPLMDFLMEHMDTEDRKLTEDMYRIYEMSEEDYFSIGEALQILEESEKPAEKMPAEPLHQMDWEPVISNTNPIVNIPEDWSEPGQVGNVSPKRNFFYPVFAVLSILGIAGAIAVHGIFELTQREEIILYGLTAVMFACLLFCLAGVYVGSRKRSNSGRTANRASGIEPQQEYQISAYREGGIKFNEDVSADRELLSLEHVIRRNTNPAIVEYNPAENDGNTIFFDERTAKEYKLYAMDKKNKNHIDLKQFPCTIGKMAGCVDYVLTDESISRIHVRFDKQEERILMTDMNSTNGTYKNGLRLQPQETVEIEPGDEVRFGNLNYCYR